MASEIDLEELKSVATALIDSLAQAGGERSIPIDPVADFYWEVPPESLYSVKGRQPTLDVGRLSDDWDLIRPIALDSTSATPLALIHLAPILRFLAERVKP